jgi:hypothetical protein
MVSMDDLMKGGCWLMEVVGSRCCVDEEERRKKVGGAIICTQRR